MQGFLISLATAVILVILGAFAAPLVVDWNIWRATFEREMSRTLGVPVTIRGGIEAELLPAPRITLRNVTLGDAVSTGGTVREFEAELSLGALMRGALEATGVTLVNPQMRLVIDSTGRIARPTGSDPATEIGIARLDVRGGTLDLLDRAADQTLTITGIDLRGEARSLAGPFKLDGEVTAAGARFGLRIALGKFDAAGSSKFRFLIDERSHPYALDLDGTFSAADAMPAFDGRASLTRKGAGGLDTWQLSGHLKASFLEVLADDLQLALGDAAMPAQLAGAARLTLGRAPGLDAVLNARNLDLDALGTAIGPAQALERAVGLLVRLPTPGMTSRLGMSAEQLVLGGTVMRDVRLDIAGDPAGWRVETVEAQLPGKAILKASGTPEGDGFAGVFALTAEDPAAVLRWAVPDAARDLAAVIQAPARMDAAFAVTPGRVMLDHLNAAFGPGRLTGSVTATLPADGTPGLDLTLSLNDVALDPVVATLERAVTASNGVEATLRLDGHNLALAGETLGRLTLQASAGNGAVRIERLTMDDFGGLRLEGAGRVEGLAATPRGTFNLSMSGSGAEGLVPAARLVVGSEAADVLARLVPIAAPVKLDTAVVWRGTDGRSIISVGRLGMITGEAAFTRSGGDGPLAVSLRADAADAAQVLATLGVAGLDPRLGPGRGEFSLTPRDDGESEMRVRLDLAGFNLAGTGTARLANGALDPRLAMRADGPDLGRLLPRVAEAADKAPVPAALAFALSRGDGTWRLENIDGTLGGAPISGSLELEPGSMPRLTGRLMFDTLSVPMLAGLSGIRGPSPAASPPWSSARFQPDAVSGIVLGLDLAASRLTLLGPYALASGRLRLLSDGADLDLRDITGAFGGGRVGAQLQIRRRGDDLEAAGRLLLDKVEIPALAAPADAQTPPTGRISLAVDLGGSGRNLAQLVRNLGGQGTLVAQDISVNAADPAALDAVLAETAALPVPPDDARTAALFARALQRAPLAVPVAETTLSVVNGMVRLSPARTSVDTTRLVFTGSLDLSRLLLDAKLEFEGTQQSGISPTGTLSWNGPLAAPERRVNANGLTSVIAMRAIERETRRLEERHAAPPTPQTAFPPPATPAPVTVRPPLPPNAVAPATAPPTRSNRSGRAPSWINDNIKRSDLPPPANGASSSGTSIGTFDTETHVISGAATTPPVPLMPITVPSDVATPETPPIHERTPGPPSTTATSASISRAAAATRRPPIPASPPTRASGQRPAASLRPPSPLEPSLPPAPGFDAPPRPPGLLRN